MPNVFFYGSFISREVLERAGFVPAEAAARPDGVGSAPARRSRIAAQPRRRRLD
jgi:hypothetical protein